MRDAFKTREQAFEHQFFHAVDRQLLEQMHDQLQTVDDRAGLQAATGIANTALLDELLAAGVDEATLVGFVLLPLAQVAWADGQVDDAERQVVLNTAIALGCNAESPGLQLLEQWLLEPPSSTLFDAWCQCGRQIVSRLSHISQTELQKTLLSRAGLVAEATGGILGMRRVAAEERQVIQHMERVLRKPTENSA